MSFLGDFIEGEFSLTDHEKETEKEKEHAQH